MEQIGDGLFRLQQRFLVDIECYAQAIAAPDPARPQRYVFDIDFCDRLEPVIAAAEALQRGQTLAPVQAIEEEARSHYARAEGAACHYLASASDCFGQPMDVDELRLRLGIGKRRRHGKPA